MFKRILDRNNYITSANVGLLPIEYKDMSESHLFGRKVLTYNDPWLRHLHIKCTDICNAKCDFCVEQNAGRTENPERMIGAVDEMLTEMKKEGILFSVSVTGGEPTCFSRFRDLIDVLKSHRKDIRFLTINSNGYKVHDYISEIDDVFDFVNISRHVIGNNDSIFNSHSVTDDDLEYIKSNLHNAKLRLQCVGIKIQTVEQFIKFLKHYFEYADDFSYRRLMVLPKEFGVSYGEKGSMIEDNYNSILKYAFNNFEFVEQTIQDYYVYEIYLYNGKQVTFSYSDMSMLRNVEHNESEDVFREFIIHPDGCISGSWKKDCKIIRP